MLNLENRRARQALCAVLRGERSLEDWPEPERAWLLRHASKQGVAGLVAPRSREAQLLRVTALTGGQVSRMAVDALEAAGIPCVVLKGAAVAALWPDPTVRPQSDVDVLVAPDELERAAYALTASGAAGKVVHAGEHHHHWILAPRAPGWPGIELHRGISSNFPVAVTARELLERRVRIETPWGEVPTLSDEDQVVYLALHAATHALARLSWLVDLSALATSRVLDLTGAVARARLWGAPAPVLLAWRAAAECLQVPVPRETLASHRLRTLAPAMLCAAAEVTEGAVGRSLAIAMRLTLQADLPRLTQTVVRLLRRRGES